MEEDDGFGFWIGGVAEVIEVAVRAQAADDGGAWRSGDGQTLGADGDFPVIADAHAGLLAPNIGPPRTLGGCAQHRTFFSERLGARGEGGDAQFAVDFVLVGVGQELVEQTVGAFQLQDAVGGQERGRRFCQ